MRVLLFSVSIPLFAACTTIKPTQFTPEAARAMRDGASIAVSRYPMPDFSAMTPGKAAFGIVGALTMISDGNTFIKENQIPDPALTISDGLRRSLVEKFKLRMTPGSGKTVADGNVEAISNANPDSDFLLDVKTINWQFSYMPTQWNSYQIRYLARVRLIDIKNKKVVAEDTCRRTPDQAKDAVSYEKITERRGQLVKDRFANYSNSCARELADKMFRISAPLLEATSPPGHLRQDEELADPRTAAAIADAGTTPSPSAFPNETDRPVPFLRTRGQAAFREFLSKPYPRAFAISDNGYFGTVWGKRPKDHATSHDVKQRALARCAERAGKPCELYMVDNEILFPHAVAMPTPVDR